MPGQFDFPPLGVVREFAPHGPAAQKEQGAAQAILVGIIHVWPSYHMLEANAVIIELRMVKLVLQELCDHFLLAQWPSLMDFPTVEGRLSAFPGSGCGSESRY